MHKVISTARHMSVTDAVAIIAGMVIGPGIFKTPAIVAALMVGISLFILRHKDPERELLKYLYPYLPFVFCLVALYMLYSSLVYTGIGALIGVAVLISGIPLLIFSKLNKRRNIYET